MARYLYVALFVAFACALQAYAAPANEATTEATDALKSLQDNLGKFFNPDNFKNEDLTKSLEGLNENFNKMISDAGPKLEQIFNQGKEYFSKLEVIPKTDQKPAPAA